MLDRLRKLVVVLAAVASVVGLLRPELYRDPEIIRAAWRPNDAVTAMIAVPLFAWSSMRARQGSIRARLVELGVLHYFAYDFAFYLFGAALNVLFPVYAVLIACSSWAIVLSTRELNLAEVPRFRARGVAAWLLIVAIGLSTTWLAQWIVALTRTTEPSRVDLTPEFVRFAAGIDLTLMVSFLLAGALLLFRRNAWGLVIGAAIGVSGALYNLVLAGSALAQMERGGSGEWPMLALWSALGIGCAFAAYRVLRRPAICFAEFARR